MRTMYLALVFVLALLVLAPLGANAQHQVRVPPYTGTNYINDFIMGDSLSTGQRRDSSAIYVLQRGQVYLANAVTRNIGWTLTIVANDSTAGVSKPIVYLYPGGTSLLPPGQFVDMRGNLVMRNLIISGYFEPIPANLSGLQGAIINTTAPGLNMTIDSCLITNTNGNHIRTDNAPKVVKITNCVFANMGYLGKSNLGAGKAIDVRAGSVDSLIVVNNTFVNWQDRIIRHFSSTANLQYLRFEHNTCVNGMSYHGFLSLGKVGKQVIIRDNLLVDPFAAGQDTDAVRQAEYIDSGEKDAFGFARMTWVISAPNDTTKWLVKNNYYRVTAAGQTFYDSASFIPIIANPALTKGSPLTYQINSKLGADSVNAFKTHTADLPNVPKLMTAMLKWYRAPFGALPDSGANKTKLNSMFRAKFDYDRRPIQYFRDTLNCAYATSNAVYTAGTGGYPVGDLNWFPAKLAQWKSDPVSSAPSKGPEAPAGFALSQNYPNPFNPSTDISYTLPKASQVKIEVFDLLGRHVATLLDGAVQAGTHSVRFDGTNLASGMYLYRLSVPGQVFTMKMMMLK